MRLATAACMQKYGNVSFATVACAKCMRYGGGPYHGGGGWDPGSGLIYTSKGSLLLVVAWPLGCDSSLNVKFPTPLYLFCLHC